MTTDTMTAPTVADLRAEADRMEAEAAAERKGRVFISSYDGTPWIHDGTPQLERLTATKREASEAEVQALRTIPEFAAALDRVRAA